MSDKGDGTPTDKDPVFTITHNSNNANTAIDAAADKESNETNKAPQNDIKKDEIINSNDDWITLFDSLSVSPFARNYFGSMSFHSYSGSTLTLIANEDMGEVPENIMTEFKSSLKNKFSNKIDVKIQTGNTSNSPIATSNRRNEKHQSDAESSI